MMRNAMYTDSLKSFSQFPPSVYRRSNAATRIQRAWRRYRGRIYRKQLRAQMNAAAMIIQRAAKQKLRRLRLAKNIAAYQIQRTWRRKLFIRKAILRCIYRKPLPTLHRAAAIIQTKWRRWKMFRNSPIAAEYNKPVDVLKAHVKTIVDWWRPLHQKRKEKELMKSQNDAATRIQSLWRGYYLRQLLRPDLRVKLKNVGESVMRYREGLFEIHGAYVLQNAWKVVLAKRVKANKIKTRNMAAARIQALWKGYWTRSRIFFFEENSFL
jgi:hypothetical protein